MKNVKFSSENLEHIKEKVYDELPYCRCAKKPVRSIRKTPVLAAMLALFIALSAISAAAVAGKLNLTDIYNRYFGANDIPFASEAADADGSISESNGIEMKLISVVADNRSFYAFIELTDTSGKQRLGNFPVDGNGHYWNIHNDIVKNNNTGEEYGSQWGICPVDSWQPGYGDTMTICADYSGAGEIKAGDKWDIYIDKMSANPGRSDSNQDEIAGDWHLSFTLDKLAEMRTLNKRYETEAVFVTVSPIGVYIKIDFDDGHWRELRENDPYNIPAELYLKDGSAVDLVYSGLHGILASVDAEITVTYKSELFDISRLDHVVFDKYIFEFE